MHNYYVEKVLVKAKRKTPLKFVADIFKGKNTSASVRRGIAGSTVIVATALVVASTTGGSTTKADNQTDVQPSQQTQPIAPLINESSSTINVQTHTESDGTIPSEIADKAKANNQTTVTVGGEEIEAKDNETVRRTITDADGTTQVNVTIQSSDNGDSSSQTRLRSRTSSSTSSSSININSRSEVSD